MATYELLSSEEKRNIILGRLRSLENNLFSIEMELVEESSVSSPDSVRVSDLTSRVSITIEKIAALKIELEKYPAPAVSE